MLDKYIGLRAGVRYTLGLGFVFVDDGEQLIKFKESEFFSVREQLENSDSAPASGAVIDSFPKIYCLYDTLAGARASWVGKELE